MMRNEPRRFLPHSPRSVGWLALAIVFLVSGLGLVGWALDIALLRSVSPQWAPMRVVTAVCLIMSAAALACLERGARCRRRLIISMVLAAAVGAVGLVTAVSYAVEFITGAPWAWDSAPILKWFLAPSTRTPAVAAILFSTFALVTLLLGAGGRRAAGAAHALLLPAAAMSYLVLAGYLFNVRGLYEWIGLGVALNTSAAFCALYLAAFCARPDTWLMGVFTGDEAGAVMARRLLPAVFIIPLAVGWLRLLGERSGLFASEVGVLLVVVAYTVCFTAMVWLIAGPVSRADRGRRESEAVLRAVMEGTTEPIYVKDRDSRMVMGNPAIFSAIGKPPAEVLGRTDLEFLDDSVAARRMMENDRQVMESGLAQTFEETVPSPEGQRVLLSTKSPYRDGSGRVIGIIAVARDITDRKRMEQELREREKIFRLFVDRTPAAVAMLDRDMRYVLYSERWLTDYGLGRQDLVGRSHYEVFPEIGEDWKAVHRRCLAGATEKRDEDPFVRADGHTDWLKWEVRPWRTGDGHIGGIILFSEVITARKEAEMALRKARDELEERVRQRTAELERRSLQLRALALELTRTEQKERKRLAAVLHDHLQQVLVGARLAIQVVRQRDLPEDVLALIGNVENLIDESIRASRSLTVDLSPPILYEAGLVGAVRWLGRWMAEKHGLAVDVAADTEIPPDDEGVSVLLFQSVREALLNVVKHAQVSTARVSIDAAEGGQIRIVVEDKGVGFDPAEVRTESPYAGFGLFSMRERIDLIGGRVDVESAPGAGTRLTLVAPLPARVTPEEAAGAGAVGPPPEREAREAAARVSPKLRILVADDHAILRQGLARLLQAEPEMEVVGEAADGVTAIEKARELRPDVVIMDVSMPRLGGIEATERITAELPGTRVIGLSMYEKADYADAMRKAGAAAYLSKGGPSEDLIAAIRGRDKAA